MAFSVIQSLRFMQLARIIKPLVFIVGILLFKANADAQQVQVGLASREAYVGQPITLQIRINDASDYSSPKIPDVPGCEIESAGTPAQSTQISIINGRRRESRSVTLSYMITPRRVGTFEIPSFDIIVDGEPLKTDPIRFVATKSENDSLLFVEIVGGKDKVYVGQALPLTLKIWIKPFVDRERRLRLSEANMWQMISRQTKWGSFGDALQRLADNNQRPGGKEVLRKDEEGEEHAYYLYEFDATVYPKRSGTIDAENVQIVVNYPTALGKGEDPFERMMGNDPFGNSPLSRLMQDDFFSSPFSNRLQVTGTRPVTADASVDSTQVVPVPTAGRPDDYRGAVGKYQIVTQANPTHVAAGDPITLQIGILGTGPMDLVQAPPLSELPTLTKDFKVEDQSLAGFVRDDTKVFPTTIRPRREGITTIPAIPFSFFDPETESYKTVYSDPIEITVDAAETLSLDSIVSNAPNRPTNDTSNTEVSLEPSFVNSDSPEILVSQTPRNQSKAWLAVAIASPAIWLAALVFHRRQSLSGSGNLLTGMFQTTDARYRKRIQRATSYRQLQLALVQYICAVTRTNNGLDPVKSIGALRVRGMYAIASEIESFLNRLGADESAHDRSTLREEDRELGLEFLERLSVEISAKRKLVNRRIPNKRLGRQVAGLALLFACGIHSPAFSQSVSGLNSEHRILILKEAATLYSQAQDLVATDKAEAAELFTASAAKYQLLIDTGITNSQLYLNAGNAYLQSNQLGRAIAAYRNSIELAPDNQQAKVNLNFANSLVTTNSENQAETSESNGTIPALRDANHAIQSYAGDSTIAWTFGLTSFAFWGLLTLAIFKPTLPLKRFAAIPLIVLLVCGSSLWLNATEPNAESAGVLVANEIKLRTGDGQQFAEIASLKNADGQNVVILNKRAGWVQIRTQSGRTGWVRRAEIVIIDPGFFREKPDTATN